MRLFRHIKWFYQRRTRGFDNRELWDLGNTMAEWLYPRIKAFRELYKHGYPCCIMDDPEFNKEHYELSNDEQKSMDDFYTKKWDNILYTIERYCELYLEDDFHYWVRKDGQPVTEEDLELKWEPLDNGHSRLIRNDNVELKEDTAKIAEYELGKANLMKYWSNLWD